MTNLYVLKKKKVRVSDRARKVLRTVVHIGFRCGVILSGILIFGVIAGAEFGPIMLGRRLLSSVMLIVLLAASWVGMELTHVDLPFDGGEEDE